MAITLNGSTGITSDNIASLAASKLTGQLPDVNAASGSVLQVVFAQKKDTQSIAHSAGITAISGLSASITPVSTTSRILVQTYIVIATSNGASVASGILLYRNGSNITDSIGDAAGSRPRMWLRNDTYVGMSSLGSFNADHGPNMLSGMYLDSPNTTSSTTYSVHFVPQNNTAMTFVINRSGNDSDTTGMWGTRCTSGLMLMEIAG
jgi:hypothetical protein